MSSFNAVTTEALPVQYKALELEPHMHYVDVHAHVFHEDFDGDEELVYNNCISHGATILTFIIICLLLNLA